MGPDEGGKQDGEGGVKKRAGKSLRRCRSSLGCVEREGAMAKVVAMKVRDLVFCFIYPSS
jgi:hypothetical protein